MKLHTISVNPLLQCTNPARWSRDWFQAIHILQMGPN